MAPGQIVVDEESGCAPALNPCVVKPSNGSEGIRTAALSTRRMQRQGTLAFTSLSVEIRFRLHQGGTMKKLRLSVVRVAVFAVGILAGCSQTATKSPDVSDSIRKSLDQAGFKDVTVSQDRDKGIVTLGGQVASENDKSQAESLAKSLAGAQVVADQIAVIPVC